MTPPGSFYCLLGRPWRTTERDLLRQQFQAPYFNTVHGESPFPKTPFAPQRGSQSRCNRPCLNQLKAFRNTTRNATKPCCRVFKAYFDTLVACSEERRSCVDAFCVPLVFARGSHVLFERQLTWTALACCANVVCDDVNSPNACILPVYPY